MIYIERKYLPVVELSENEQRFDLGRVKKLLCESQKTMIYFERDEKLVGIFGLGDYKRAIEKDLPCVINGKFTALHEGEYAKARNILHEKRIST